MILVQFRNVDIEILKVSLNSSPKLNIPHITVVNDWKRNCQLGFSFPTFPFLLILRLYLHLRHTNWDSKKILFLDFFTFSASFPLEFTLALKVDLWIKLEWQIFTLNLDETFLSRHLYTVVVNTLRFLLMISS